MTNSHSIEAEIERRAAHVAVLLMDCDGVLTDGRITQLETGDELKSFHTRDGQGLVLLHLAGIRTGIISGRKSSAVERRARELGIDFLFQGIGDKVVILEDLLVSETLHESRIAYVGDDLTDIPVMSRVGLAIAVADAAPETKATAHLITNATGGFGAIREVCELILKSQGKWHDVIKAFTG